MLAKEAGAVVPGAVEGPGTDGASLRASGGDGGLSGGHGGHEGGKASASAATGWGAGNARRRGKGTWVRTGAAGTW